MSTAWKQKSLWNQKIGWPMMSRLGRSTETVKRAKFARPSLAQSSRSQHQRQSQAKRNIEQTMSVQDRHAKPGCDETQKRAAEAKQKTRHRKDASRHVENEKLLRIRSTMEKLKASRFKCTCGSKTSFHGSGDKKCGLFDRGGFQRRMGEDTGVTDAQFHEVKAF